MTRNETVVLVSTDTTDKVIKSGPYQQNSDAPGSTPDGQQWMPLYQALGQGYAYPRDHAIPSSPVDTLQQKAGQALVNNKAFLALDTPANAQIVAQVKALTRQVSALIRLEIGALDTTDGT